MNYQKQTYNNKKSKENIFSNIKKIIEYIYSQNFTEILIEEKTTFINKIETKILELLKYQFKENESQYQKELSTYEKSKESIKARYDSDYLLLNSEYKKYKKYPNKVPFLKNYRKHCINSEQAPIHKCSSNKFGKLIEVFHNPNIKNKLSFSNKAHNTQNSYVICTECSKCYMNAFIKIYCESCKCDYFSSKLEDNENENILPATWKEYHCQPIIVNEMMKCIKCENILYINLISKKLICLNKKCNFSSNPHNIIWKCKICKKDFRSSAKVFNPLESRILQYEVWKCLLYKNPAQPKKVFCCQDNEKNKNIKYFHDKKCKGELYKWSYDDREIIVCGLCHAVNFYDKFIWTCPSCNTRFNYHGKKHRNENENNKNLILKNNSKVNIKNGSFQNYNSENKPIQDNKPIKENSQNSISNNKRQMHRQNLSNNIKIFTTDDDNNNLGIEEKKLIYENNLSIPSIEACNTIDLNKNISLLRNDDENLKNPIYINHNIIPKPKYSKKKRKVRYQTLFDILEEREKYKINNQSRDENINNENLTNAKIKLDEYYNKKRIKLLEQSKPKTSMKKDKKTLLQKYFDANEKKNILINNFVDKNSIYKNNDVENNIINISDIDEKQLLNNKEAYLFEYESVNKNLQKKLSGDLNKYSTNIIGLPIDLNNPELRVSNFKDRLYSKRYKDDRSTITNEELERNEKKNRSKKKDIGKNLSFRNRINIDKKKYYIQESNNKYKNNFLRNISAKKNSDNTIKRNISLNNNNQKEQNYLKKYCKKYSNIIRNENKENKNYNKEEIYIDEENEFNLENENTKENEVVDEKDNINSMKWKKNQIFKRIFLNKIKQNTRNIMRNEDLELFNNSQIESLNNNNLINNMEMRISPLGDIGQDIVSKDDFLKIANECKIPTFDENNITYLNPIGQGSYGVIYLVEEKNSKKQYALKRVLCQDIEQILKHKKEFELCYSLNHPNIIKIHNVLFKYLDMTTYLLYILMEKAETDWNTEIEKRVKSQNFYSESELINIMKQLVSALYYFQKKNVAHRDIKPQNILICANNIYKITDLGEAKNINNNTQLATLKGSQLFMSPNLFLVLKYDGNKVKVKHNIFKSDVFSLGYCFIYAMSLDLRLIKSLREETSMIDVLSIIKRSGVENKYSEKFMNIIYKMIQTDENKRYDFFELYEEINKCF